MERVRDLIQPYLTREGVVGIYVVGSATRPFRDGLSDYDIEVVVTDEVYDRTPDDERHILVIEEGPPRRVDHEFYLWPWRDFTALRDSDQDLFHFAYQHAAILHDPEGRIAAIVSKLAELPDIVREQRMRVHFLEFIYGSGRARKTLERGSTLNVRMVLAAAVRALVKLLFLQHGSWAPTLHWSEQELRELGIPVDLITQMTGLLADPTEDALRGLVERVKARLTEREETFHDDVAALDRWAFLTAEGKRAFARWGSGSG